MISNSDFKGRLPSSVILVCLRWYLRYAHTYRDLVEIMNERGVETSHTTIKRWIHHFSPLLGKRLRRKLEKTGGSWKLDETYIKVKDECKYLYRAVDKEDNTLEFLLTAHRDQLAAMRFLKKILETKRYQHR